MVYVVTREWEHELSVPRVFSNYRSAVKCQTALINEMKGELRGNSSAGNTWIDSSNRNAKSVETDHYGVVGVVYLYKVELED